VTEASAGDGSLVRARTVGDVRPLYAPARLLKANLHELAETVDQAKRDLQAIQAEADRARRDLTDEAEHTRAETQREAAEIRRQAYADGVAAGRAEMTALIRELQGQIADLQRQWPADVQRVAFAIARRILDVEFRVDPDRIVDLVACVLRSARFYQDVTVVLHPDDLARVAPHQAVLRQGLIHAEHVRLRADATLAPHGVRIETNRGVFDGVIEHQFQRLEALWFAQTEDGVAPDDLSAQGVAAAQAESA
jgi:flagellar biosynthesis/type III secretory pathway protein FliH